MFRIYIAVACENEDQIYRRSGCGIMTIADTTPKYKRAYYYGLGSHNRTEAIQTAIKIALSSIKSKFRKEKTEVFVAEKLLEQPYREDLKLWMGYYDDLSISFEASGKIIEETKKLAEQGCEEQNLYDSKELYYEVSE